jgi:hypothetical protein
MAARAHGRAAFSLSGPFVRPALLNTIVIDRPASPDILCRSP